MKDSQKDSPEHQEAFIRETAAREGVEISHFYEDRDTATSIVSREDVQKMISDAKRGEIRSIWFASLSRFCRDAIDAISLKRILVNALKIRMVSIEDGYDSGVKDDELLFGIKSFVNQNTSGDIGVSSRRGIKASAESGNFIGSIPPYGYKKATIADVKMKSGKRKTLEVIPEQAAIVRTIFEMYIGGDGEKAIVNFLNGEDGEREAIPSYKGGVWGITSVQRILQNENYTGYNTFGRHTSEVTYNDLSDLMNRGKKLVQKPKSDWNKSKYQTHEAIVSKEDFDKAQEIRLLRGGGERGGRRAFVNVFAKFIFCAECGSAMVSMSSKVRGQEYRYLMCSKRRRTGAAGCNNGNWIPYYDMRDELIGGILKRVEDAMVAMTAWGSSEVGAELPQMDVEKEIKKLEKRIEDNRKLLFEIRRQHMLGEMDVGQYEFEKTQYEKEISEVDKKLKLAIAQQKARVDVEKTMRNVKKAHSELTKLKKYDDVEKTRALLIQMVDRIEVSRDGSIRVETPLKNYVLENT